MDNWTKLPFYSAQLILKKLPYGDIINASKAIPYLQAIYDETNSTLSTKFIFDQLTDDTRVLVQTRTLKQIYFNFRKSDKYTNMQLMTLLNLQRETTNLFIKDDWFFTNREQLWDVLQTEFSHLTHLTIEATHTYAPGHTISPLLNRCTALEEFTYRHGTLKFEDMRMLWKLKKLKLVSVKIESCIDFQMALKKMAATLLHFEFFSEMKTACMLNFDSVEMIYYTLRHLSNLKILKIMALRNTHEFKKLIRPRDLEKLTIVTLNRSFLPNLYHSLSHLTVENLMIEEWVQPYIYPPLDEATKARKVKLVAKLKSMKPNIQLVTIPPERFSTRRLIIE